MASEGLPHPLMQQPTVRRNMVASTTADNGVLELVDQDCGAHRMSQKVHRKIRDLRASKRDCELTILHILRRFEPPPAIVK